MAGASSVREDGSLLSRLDTRLYGIERILALVSGLACFSLMVFAVVSVTGRNAINMPVPGYVDWIEQIMPLIAFMGIAFVQRDGGHIRMDILVGNLKGRALWMAEFTTVFFMLALMLLLVWGSWAHFERSFDWNAPLYSTDSSIDIAIPLWPAKLLAPVAFGVLCIRLVLQLWAYGLAIQTGEEHPIAVPVPLSAAEVAAAEAATVSDAPHDSSREGGR
ncbi:MAG: TRAP transporter small permease [Pseudomonadota bacterium]